MPANPRTAVPSIRGDLAALGRENPQADAPGPSLPKRRGALEIQPSARLERLDLILADFLLAHAVARRDHAGALILPLADAVRYTRVNRNADIEAGLRRLTTVPVRFNTEGKDKGWPDGEPAPLLQAAIRDVGRRRSIVWDYPAAMREALLWPKPYAWIDLDVQARMQSRFGVLLYQRLAARAGFGGDAKWAKEREWRVSRADLAAILTIDPAMSWPHLRDRVLAPALADVRLSRRFQPFVDEIHGSGRGRGGRPVTALRFWTERRGTLDTLPGAPAGVTKRDPTMMDRLAEAARDAPPYAVSPYALIRVAAAVRKEFQSPDFDPFIALTHWRILILEALEGAAPVGHPRRGDALLARLLRQGADRTLAEALFGEARDGWPAYGAVAEPHGLVVAKQAAADRWATFQGANRGQIPSANLISFQSSSEADDADDAAPEAAPINDAPAPKDTARSDGAVSLYYHWRRLLTEPTVAATLTDALAVYAVDGDRRALRATVNRAVTVLTDAADEKINDILAACRAAGGGFTVTRRFVDFGLVTRAGTVIDGAVDLLPESLPGWYALSSADIRRLETVAPWLTVVVGPGGR